MKTSWSHCKALSSVLLLAGLMLSNVATAQTTLFLQLPGHIGGFDSNGQNITVADQFAVSAAANIQNITWWGGYFSPTVPASDAFTIRLYADNGGQPGALLQSYSGINPPRMATGDFENPPSTAEYIYSFDLPVPFLASANTTYWLSIVNDPSIAWDWETAASTAFVQGVQRSFSDPVSGPWEPFPSHDVAFQLKGSPVPPPPLNVQIDIKPGEFPNNINLRSNGVVAVAILSTSTFDATQVDPSTVTLAGAPVRLIGKGKPQASFEDVNNDGLPDLVVHVSTQALSLTPNDTQATLTGSTFSGTQIIGTDSVLIVH